MKVLAINTYGGSLLLGARAAGAEIVGSYEDAGFGSEIQRENFPKIPLATRREDWPNWGNRMHEVVAIAHPPCSAFSMQNAGADEARGVGSAAFACTKHVLEYALSQKCAALAVESVPAALEGGRAVHEAAAKKHGYELHRVLQNAILFGAPQWRERFWAVFVRKDLAPSVGMAWSLSPVTKPLGDVLPGYVGEDAPLECEKDFLKLLAKLQQRAGINMGTMRDAIARESSDFSGSVSEFVVEHMPERGFKNAKIFHQEFVGGFTSRALRFLAPGDYAPTLMSDSWWWYAGRQMSLADYSRVMGFPPDYVWPGKTSQQRRLYLSKGVVPAVARWVLEVIAGNLGYVVDKRSLVFGVGVRKRFTKNGEVALFRGARNKWARFLQTEEPPVREE